MCTHLCNSKAGEEAALHVIMSLNEVRLDTLTWAASILKRVAGDGRL